MLIFAQVVFYGLLSAAQLAAYAFSVAFSRVHLMQKSFRPPEGEFERQRAAGLVRQPAMSQPVHWAACMHAYIVASIPADATFYLTPSRRRARRGGAGRSGVEWGTDGG